MRFAQLTSSYAGYNLPAERKEVLKAPNPDNIKSGFCESGKCGGGEAIKEVTPAR